MFEDDYSPPSESILTDSELARRAKRLKASNRKYKIKNTQGCKESAEPLAITRDRWINWDALAIGEDFWDTVDELDGERKREIREQRQMEEIRRIHERRLDAKQIDMAAFEADPYAEMARRPGAGRSEENVSSAAQDREIIEANWCAIECLLVTGAKAAAVAREFNIYSPRVLRSEAKKRGWVE